MVREYWERTRWCRAGQNQAITDSIRLKLGLPVPRRMRTNFPTGCGREQTGKQTSLAAGIRQAVQITDRGRRNGHLSQALVVLLRNAWKPMLYSLVVMVLMIARAWILFQSPDQAFLEPNSVACSGRIQSWSPSPAVSAFFGLARL